MNLYQKTEQFMINAFRKAGDEMGVKHHQRVLYWVKKLEPRASENLLVAAIMHDIERAIYGDWKACSIESSKVRKHQDLSALEASKFLEKEGINSNKINRIKELISHHQEGGDEEQNILCDADAITYFENSALRHARNYREKGRSKKEMKAILEYNYNRISTDKAQEITKKWYKEALEELNAKT